MRPRGFLFEQQNVVTFRVVEYGPGGTAAAGRRFAAYDSFVAYVSHRFAEIGDFEKQDGFIRRGIIFGAFAFEADEPLADVKLGVMARLLVLQFEAEAVAIKFLRRVQIIEVEFDAGESKAGVRAG